MDWLTMITSHQVIAKPTRRNTSLKDHFITSNPEKIKLTFLAVKLVIMMVRISLSVIKSKAFDTVQHHTFIQKLNKIGFQHQFISYLGNRSQYVQVNDSKSATKLCHFGVIPVHCY